MPRKVNRAEQRRLKEEAKAAAGGAGAEGEFVCRVMRRQMRGVCREPHDNVLAYTC